jgi:hypothetical protein
MGTSAPVDTTVITLEPIDYGAGPTDRVVFHDCKFRVDDTGTLHVFPADDTEKVGNVATYAPGQWTAAIRGQIVSLGADHPDRVGQHQLKAVESS